MNNQRIRLAGLWRNKSKSGISYLSGRLGGARLLIFENSEKRTEQSPDFTLYLAPDERRDDARDAGSTPQAPARPPAPTPPFEGDVPF